MAEKLKVNKREDLIRMLTDTVSIAIPIDKEVIFELMCTHVYVCVYMYTCTCVYVYVYVYVTCLQSKDELGGIDAIMTKKNDVLAFSKMHDFYLPPMI